MTVLQLSFIIALPHKTVNLLSINDASPTIAKRILETQLKTPYKNLKLTGGQQDIDVEKVKSVDAALLDEVVDTLGGRLQDLELFTQKVHSGQDPKGKQ